MAADSTSVKLPELGEGVTEGELVKWLVKPGDSVKPDQPVAEVMTDKATVEVPSPVGGTVKELKFKVGDVIKVENIILTLEAGGSTAAISGGAAAAASGGAAAAASGGAAAATPNGAAAATSGSAAAPAKTAAAAPSPATRAPASTGSTGLPAAGATAARANDQGVYPPVADFRTLATPSTRRLARETHVDINQIPGSGLAGRVTREDVLAASASGGVAAATSGGMDMHAPAAMRPSLPLRTPGPLTAGGAEERVPLRGIRKKIAENLQFAKQVIPHFTLMDEAVVTELVKTREGLKDFAAQNGVKITYLPFVMKALISTCRQYGMFNASIDDAAGEIVYKKYFNIGFAADTPNGLVVPVIKNADMKSILELSLEITDLSKRARDGKLKPDEMKGATITITNIGSVGGTYATPIINHPEVAILGMYKISDKVVVDEKGQFKAVKSMNFTITADHRLIDGAVAANFLKDFIAKIQNPGRLMLDMM